MLRKGRTTMGAAGTELAKGSGQGHRPDETQAHAGVALAAGFGAGMVVAGLLNPVDRALYLSVAQRTPFLHRSNFRSRLPQFDPKVLQPPSSWRLHQSSYTTPSCFSLDGSPLLKSEFIQICDVCSAHQLT